MDRLTEALMGLLLAACPLGALACFIMSGDQNDGSFAVAGAILVLAFFYGITHSAKET